MLIYLDAEKGYFTEIRGKSEVPPEFRAGEFAHNSSEFYEALKTVLEEGNRHEVEQEQYLELIHGIVDGKASERVIKIIEGLLEE